MVEIDQVTLWVADALEQLCDSGALPKAVQPLSQRVQVQRAKDNKNGDFSTNIAMICAKSAKISANDLADMVVQQMLREPPAALKRAEVAGPGFINLFLADSASLSVLKQILEQGDDYGQSQLKQPCRVQVEFVSANPTGPLHVGHGRGAAYGASLANVLKATGYAVEREYYVNDAGRQMQILALSIWLRYLQIQGATLPMPAGSYLGDYVIDLAQQLGEQGDAWVVFTSQSTPQPAPQVREGLSEAEQDEHIDQLVEYARQQLGAERWEQLYQCGLQSVLADIREDLHEFGVDFQHWFCESELTKAGQGRSTLEEIRTRLEQAGHLYLEGDAQWFRSSALGDNKDRVFCRANGQYTYFAMDAAYHFDKFQRGFDRVINVWGADHHGYVPRIRAVLQALGVDPTKLEVRLVQFATLKRGGEKISMSTRGGKFVTLRSLREEVGRDAARLFYLIAGSDQHLEFDLEVASQRSKDNPVYYIQYAHARVCSLHRRMPDWDSRAGLQQLELLQDASEQELINLLMRYPDLLKRIAGDYRVYRLTHYLIELATRFHSWYDNNRFLDDAKDLQAARLCLCEAVRQVLHNGLKIMGVNAPEEM